MFSQLIDQVKHTPVHRVRDLGEGPATVEGRAVAIRRIEAPITGQAVIGYQIVFDLELASGKTRRLNLASVVDFDVMDDTGRVRVNTAGVATLVLGHEYSADSAAMGSAAAPVMGVLANHLDEHTFRSLSGYFTWHMFYLEHGEPATVCGEVGRVLGDEHGRQVLYRDNAFLPAIRRPAQGLLVVSDMPRPALVDYLVPS